MSVAAKFHAYSQNNVLLIIAPRPYRVTTETAPDEEKARERLTFRLVPVFDLEQTTGDPLPVMEAPTLTGDADADDYHALVRFAASDGLTVTSHDPNTDGDDPRSSYHGYYSPGRKLIFVKRAAPAQMLKTLIHELGHHLDPELELAPVGERETVAEATAFVVAHQGIDTGSYSFPYIATWAGQQDGPTLIKQVLGRVQPIAHRLIASILDEQLIETAALQDSPRLAA